ncbi:septal ring lytic transglycosylase RlpA family protein [Phenylobacterium sp. LjRoot225]|uniref:septal ring lytic transglycosylase RlpA family protein n=1 Tax=Phenylobacterium sp. LjRoot225 TaxID=3342285 RepID=UPI003ECC39E5
MVRGNRSVLAAIALLSISAGLTSTAWAADGGQSMGASPSERLGLADWRGQAFDGRTTANGDRFDMYQLTAASADLPLNSYAAVTNMATGESVVVRINDRLPTTAGPAITLSFAAAHRLGVDAPGAAPVRISTLGAPPSLVKPARRVTSVAMNPASGGWFAGLRLARLSDELSGDVLDEARQEGARAFLRGRGRRQPLMVTWAEDTPVPLPGL